MDSLHKLPFLSISFANRIFIAYMYKVGRLFISVVIWNEYFFKFRFWVKWTKMWMKMVLTWKSLIRCKIIKVYRCFNLSKYHIQYILKEGKHGILISWKITRNCEYFFKLQLTFNYSQQILTNRLKKGVSENTKTKQEAHAPHRSPTLALYGRLKKINIRIYTFVFIYLIFDMFTFMEYHFYRK